MNLPATSAPFEELNTCTLHRIISAMMHNGERSKNGHGAFDGMKAKRKRKLATLPRKRKSYPCLLPVPLSLYTTHPHHHLYDIHIWIPLGAARLVLPQQALRWLGSFPKCPIAFATICTSSRERPPSSNTGIGVGFTRRRHAAIESTKLDAIWVPNFVM